MPSPIKKLTAFNAIPALEPNVQTNPRSLWNTAVAQ